MASTLSQLPWRSYNRAAHPHSAHVQPASRTGAFGPKVSAVQSAGMHPVGAGQTGLPADNLMGLVGKVKSLP